MALFLDKIGGTRQTESKHRRCPMALFLDKIGGTRQTESKLSFVLAGTIFVQKEAG